MHRFRILQGAIACTTALFVFLPGVAHAAMWKFPLKRSGIGAQYLPQQGAERRAVTGCDPAVGVPYYAENASGLWVDSPAGFPGSPAGTLAPGAVVAAAHSGDQTARIQLSDSNTYYQVEIGRICLATFATPLAIKAAAGGKPLPNLQLVGPITPYVRASIRRLAQTPVKAMNQFNGRNGIGVLVTRGSIANVQGWEGIVGRQCSLGRECDGLSGLGNSQLFDNPAFITRPDTRILDDTVAIHEYGHSVDSSSYPYPEPRLSERAEWRNGPFKEAQRCWDYDYERRSASEWFATSFEKSYSSVAASLWLKKYCPVTYKFHRAHWGAGSFDSTLRDDGMLEGELRTATHSPVVRAAPARRFLVVSRLGGSPGTKFTSGRISAYAVFGNRKVGAVSWNTRANTSSRVLTTRGVPKGALVKVCVKASGVGRGFAPIPAWCAKAKAR